VQPHKKQHAHEKEMQQLKLQQAKDLQQDEDVVLLQNNQHEEQHEKLLNEEQHEKLQDAEQQEDLQEEDNLFFSFFYLNYRMLILPRNFRA